MIKEKMDIALGDSDDPILVAVCDDSPVEHRSLERHQHARGQLTGLRQGLFTLGTEMGAWVIPSEYGVWMPPRQAHYGYSHGAVEIWSCYISERTCEALPKTPCLVKMTGLLRESVLRASQWPAQDLSERQARLALVILDELCAASTEPFGLTMPSDARLVRIAEALLNDPGDRRNVGEWATWAGISERSLSRRFVTETGYTYTEWRQRARIMRALEMLADGASVTSVAFDLGYDSVSAFIALFKRLLGSTPSHYFESC